MLQPPDDASQLGLQFGNQFLTPGQKGPLHECEQLGCFGSQEGRREEATQAWGSQGSDADRPLVSTLRQVGLQSESIFGRGLYDFHPLFLGLAKKRQSATSLRSCLNKN